MTTRVAARKPTVAAAHESYIGIVGVAMGVARAGRDQRCKDEGGAHQLQQGVR